MCRLAPRAAFESRAGRNGCNLVTAHPEPCAAASPTGYLNDAFGEHRDRLENCDRDCVDRDVHACAGL